MTLVPSLLQAIVQVDGEALVLHAGEKPYVVTPGGQVDLASRGLTLDAVNGIVGQLLPPEVLHALDEFGAAQFELAPRPDFQQEQFTVVVARGGDDVWAEIRRRRVTEDDRVPDDIFGPAATAGIAADRAAAAGAQPVDDAIGFEDFGSTPAQAAPAPVAQDDDLQLPPAEQLWGSEGSVDLSLDLIADEPGTGTTALPHPIEEAAPERVQSEAPEPLSPAAFAPAAVAIVHEVAALPAERPSETAAAAELTSAAPEAESHPVQQPADGLKTEVARLEAAVRHAEEEAARHAEAVRISEAARASEVARLEEAARRAEEEAARHAEAVGIAEAALISETARLEEAVRHAEEDTARHAEAVDVAEAARHSEVARLEAAVRHAEEEAARHAEAITIAEIARASEVARLEEAARIAEEKAARIAEDAVAAEAARIAEVARLEELVRRMEGLESEREAARLAEATETAEEHAARMSEAARRAEADRRADIARLEEAVKRAEEESARHAETVKIVETARASEVARLEEAARTAENEAARIAEAARSAEAARLADIARLEAAVKLAEEETARYADAVKIAETARVSEVARLEEAARVAENEAARIGGAARSTEADRLANIARLEEAARAAENEAARIAEAARSAEAARLADIARLEEAVKRAEEESARYAVAVKIAETARASEVARLEEAARAAENETARIAEAARRVEVDRLADITLLEDAVRAAENEAAQIAEAARGADANRLADIARLEAAVRIAENEAARSAEAASVTEAARLADAVRFEAAGRLAEEEIAKLTEALKIAEAANAGEIARLVQEVSRLAQATGTNETARLETAVGSPRAAEPAMPYAVQSQPAVVLPMARNPIRSDVAAPVAAQTTASGLDRLLRLAAARGASTLYLASDAKPSVRVDGENETLDGEPTLTPKDVESLLLTLMPDRSHEALRTGAATEWICDIEDVGRVRCMSFRDQRGPGGVFRLMPGRTVSMDQLALSREIQALAVEPEGLVLVAGPRSSGKRTLLSAFIDVINRTRPDHVISIESEINIVHERGASLISQREVRGSNDEVLAAARAALREDPDVLVIEDLRTAALMDVALEASASGHLVIGGFSAHSAPGAIDRVIDLYAPEYRRQIQMALAEQVRGVVVQVLLKKNGGGRLAARELLLNTPAVAGVIAEGKTSQLLMAIEGGRRHGMVPLNDALVGYVQSGTVDAREAYRRSADRPGFLSLLKRQGIDTSGIERMA